MFVRGRTKDARALGKYRPGRNREARVICRGIIYVSLGKRRGWAMGCWGKQGQSDGDDDDGLKSMVNISGLLLVLECRIRTNDCCRE